MSNANGSHDERDFEELSLPLVRAVEAVVTQPLPEASVERALARLGRQTASRGGDRREPRRRNRNWLLAAGTAAAMLVAAGVWLSSSSVSWAEVAKALAGKGWIHGVASGGDGAKFECWFSTERGSYADLCDKRARYDDYRLHIRTEYDPDVGRIVRQLWPDKDTARSFADLFAGIVRGRAPVGLIFEGKEVMSQESRRVVDDDRQWLEYDLMLRGTHDLKANRLARMRFRVDPVSHLPLTMTVTPLPSPDESDAANDRIEMTFDYPDRGPIDIYDLGAPRTAELIDRVPNDDLKRILAAVETGRKDFDSYFAVIVRQGANDPWYSGSQILIWRKGARWRAEMRAFDELPPQPEADADRVVWWKQQVRHNKYQPLAVCDGKTVYRVKIGEADAQGKPSRKWEPVRRLNANEGIDAAWQSTVRDCFVERYGYPETLVAPSSIFAADIDSRPSEGPNDSLLIKYLGTPELKTDGAFRDCRYWVDPGKGYVTRRYVLADSKQAGVSQTDAYSMEDFERSPRGIWYPTLVRRKVTQDPPPMGNWTDETVYRFFLDFKTDLPDDLFRPDERR